MTAFTQQIDTAATQIKANGMPVTVRRQAGASQSDYTEADFGTATFDGTVVFAQDVSGAISVGDRISFAEIGSFANRSERQVTAVSGNTVSVDSGYSVATEDTYRLIVKADQSIESATFAVVDTGGRSWAQQFRDGTLLRSQAKVMFIAAKGLPIRIRPGDTIDDWLVSDVNTTEPDGTPILYEVLVKRG